MTGYRLSASLFLLIFFVALLSDCSNHKVATQDTFGDLDKKVIAADTGMEANMDLSYEYSNTLKESDSVVYDFLAYDKPARGDSLKWESRFHIIRRAAAHQDTIAKDFRAYPVRSIWLSDLDQNGKSEIMFYTSPLRKQQASEKSPYFTLIGYEANGRSPARRIVADLRQDEAHYQGGDTFFVYQNYLIRRFPYYKEMGDTLTDGYIWQSYRLHASHLILEKEKRDQ